MNTAVDVRLGKVTDVNKEKRLVRCKFEDTGITSGWLPVMQHYKAIVYTESAGEHNHQYIHPSPYNLEIKTTMDGSRQIWDEEEKVIGADNSTNHQHKSHVVWWLPAIDDTVVCLYLPCFNADGFVLGGIYPRLSVASETSVLPCSIAMSRPSRTWCKMYLPDILLTSAPEARP